MTIDFGDDLNDAEMAYLESGGKVTDGLPAPSAPSEPAAQDPAPAPTQSQQQDAQQPAADDDDDDGDDDDEIVVGPDGKLRAKDGKFVSQKALHKERMKRKAAAAERDDLRIKLAKGEERLAILNEAFAANGEPRSATAPQGQQQPQQQQTPNPFEESAIDPEADFFGWAKQVERQKNYLARQLTETTSSTQQRETFRAVTETYHADAKRFMASEPNFQDAYMSLVAGRHRELEFMGMKNERERNAYIAQEETQIVVQALQSGQSPAQMMYQLAQARGFTPKQAAAMAQNGNGQSAPAPQVQRTPAQNKIEQLRNGQNAAQSLSNVAGGANEGLTFNALANMSDAEFDAVTSNMSKQQLERFLGR